MIFSDSIAAVQESENRVIVWGAGTAYPEKKSDYHYKNRDDKYDKYGWILSDSDPCVLFCCWEKEFK